MVSVSFSVREFYSNPVFPFLGQSVYLVQSKPKLAIQVPEPSFVVCPELVKINRAVKSLLYHCPPSAFCCLVTINIKWDAIIWIDRVHTTGSTFTRFVKISTVSRNGCGKITEISVTPGLQIFTFNLKFDNN